jgi:hypothetical protein
MLLRRFLNENAEDSAAVANPALRPTAKNTGALARVATGLRAAAAPPDAGPGSVQAESASAVQITISCPRDM